MNEKQKQNETSANDRHYNKLVKKDIVSTFGTLICNYQRNSGHGRKFLWSPLCHTGFKASLYGG
jgi:hypothetical protein